MPNKKDEEALREAELGRRIQLKFSVLGARVFRNNNGVGWVGKSYVVRAQESVPMFPGDVLIRHARPLHAGLMPGSSDYIGWQTVIVTPAMVGRKFALFTSPEIKTLKGEKRIKQDEWICMVNSAGGRAGYVRSEETASTLIGLP